MRSSLSLCRTNERAARALLAENELTVFVINERERERKRDREEGVRETDLGLGAPTHTHYHRQHQAVKL